MSGNVTQTDDGNYLVPISAKDGLAGGLPFGSYAVKIDETGAIIWMEKFSDAATQTSEIMESPDGGYLAQVFKNIPATGQNGYFLQKLNSTFELEAELYIDDLGISLTDVLFTSDTNFVIGGGLLNEGKIKKYDLDLNLIWELPTSQPVIDVKLTIDGNLIATSNNSNLFKFF